MFGFEFGRTYEDGISDGDVAVINTINHLNKKRKAEAWQDMESRYIDRQDEDEENQ